MHVDRLADRSRLGPSAEPRVMAWPSLRMVPVRNGPCAATRASCRPLRDRLSIDRIAQPRGIFGDGVQHRLNVRRRTGDDAQNFTCRGLLLQRLLEFLKQPHVLDGDHGLVGESFEQLDLRRGEGAHLDATRAQYSNEFSLLTKGNDQEGARAAAEPNIGKSFCARTSGMWSVPCSRIQRNSGASILISTRPGYGTKMSPRNHHVPRRGVAAPHHRSHKPAPRSRRWRRAPAARPWASG